MTNIFVSYRRDDAGYVAGMLAEHLKQAFGSESVFIDVDTIPLGVDFRDHITNAVANCNVFLAVIGDNWHGRRDSTGLAIERETDPVRIEIEAALRRQIPIVPVLVGKAQMPTAAQLPESIRDLSFRNAAEVRSGRDMKHHMDALIEGLQKHLLGKPREPELSQSGTSMDAMRKDIVADTIGNAFCVARTSEVGSRVNAQQHSSTSAGQAFFRPKRVAAVLVVVAMIIGGAVAIKTRDRSAQQATEARPVTAQTRDTAVIATTTSEQTVPRWSKLLIAALTAMANGSCPKELMTSLLRATCEDNIKQMQPYIAKHGPIKEAAFVGEDETEMGRGEVYRVICARGAMLWILIVGIDGKISSLWTPAADR